MVFSDDNVIAALIYSDPVRSPWLLFCIYGPPRKAKRKRFWAKLEEMVKAFSGPWVVFGDFNSIKELGEKKGGSNVFGSSVNDLRSFMNNTGAIDLEFSGPVFTWTNRREGLANIKERLDQCFCDHEWKNIFPKAGIRHLSNSNSDHNPTLMDTYMEETAPDRPFRFEAMWTKEESSKEVVENAWLTSVEGSQGYRLARKLDATKRDLKRWNKNCFGISRERIKELEAKIARLQVSNPTRGKF